MSTEIKEDAPTNAMGASSSTSGPINTYDPLLVKKAQSRVLPFSKFRRITRGKQSDVKDKR